MYSSGEAAAGPPPLLPRGSLRLPRGTADEAERLAVARKCSQAMTEDELL